MNCTQMLSILRKGIFSHWGAQSSHLSHLSLLTGPFSLGSLPIHFILWAQRELSTNLMIHFDNPDRFIIGHCQTMSLCDQRLNLLVKKTHEHSVPAWATRVYCIIEETLALPRYLEEGHQTFVQQVRVCYCCQCKKELLRKAVITGTPTWLLTIPLIILQSRN